MTNYRIYGLPTVLLMSSLITGCATRVGPVIAENPVSNSVLAPRIETVNKKAHVVVGEAVSGYGCRESYFGIFKHGDRHLLIIGDKHPQTDLEYAKASAAYDALFGRLKDHPPVYHQKQKPFPNDILVAPTYHLEIISSLFSQKVCATVTGFRGFITKLTDADSTTAWPTPEYKIIRSVD